PSGKAELCNSFIPQFKSGWRLQYYRGKFACSDFFMQKNNCPFRRFSFFYKTCGFAGALKLPNEMQDI
ncbi:hypothetical protein, partial [Monoglobus pectinilyticus]|uniref:hypothetical protein n=1 Tax=Monoglobus pectinilyticus TaxID=1981510 RepID=UPI003AB68CDF